MAPSSRSSSAAATAAPPDEVEKALRELKTRHQFIRSELDEAESRRIDSQIEKLYLKHLKEADFDAEDAIMDADLKQLQAKVEDQPVSGSPTCERCRKRKHPEEVSNLTSLHCNGIPCWNCVWDKIDKVHRKYLDAAEQRKSFSWKGGDGKIRKGEGEALARPQTGSMSNERNIYSREGDKEDIIEFLGLDASSREDYIPSEFKRSERKNIIIVPIVGVGGIGKTTLAQHVFIDARINEMFDCKGWVCVYGKTDVQLLTEAVLESITRSARRFVTLDTAQDILKGRLMRKKFLLVLDDVWIKNGNFWSTFWAPLSASAADSIVAIVTTQNYSVMKAMPLDIPQTEPFSLPPLPFDDCLNLFKSKVYQGRVGRNHAELELIIEKIVRKYEGFPSAIKIAAQELRSRHVQEWNEFLERNSNGSNWEVGYRALKAPLKRCFMYFALFPKGYPFKKDQLIKLWIAEGFIESQGNRNLEDIGSDYFMELVYHSFLCHSETANEYVMPSVVRDLANSISLYCISRDDSMDLETFSNVRYLSYIVNDAKMEIQCPQVNIERLRAFLVIRNINMRVLTQVKFSNNGLQSLGYLRSLDLSYSNIEELPESISYLRHLHYLGLNCTPIKILPESICTLCSLQTLQLKLCWNLQGLPAGIGRLIKLRHLDLDANLTSFFFPIGLGKLTELQTLPVFIVGKSNSGCGGILELQSLKNIKGELLIMGLCNVNIEDKGLKLAVLENTEFLTKVSLCWPSQRTSSRDRYLNGCGSQNSSILETGENTSTRNLASTAAEEVNREPEHDVLVSLKPHTNLTDLVTESYCGTRFPNWIGCRSFNKIKFMKLENCMNCDKLPSLGLLPSLRYLVIDSVSVVNIDREFCGCTGSFTALEMLCIRNMCKLEKWCGIDNGDFPELQVLELYNCPKLKKVAHIAYSETSKTGNRGELSTFPTHPSFGLNEREEQKGIGAPYFPKLQEVELFNCPHLKGIFGIASLKTLKMNNCGKMASFPGLINLTTLELCACGELIALPKLLSLNRLHVMYCNGLVSLPDVSSLTSLWIEDCKQVTFSALKELLEKSANLKNLLVTNCDNIVFSHEELQHFSLHSAEAGNSLYKE